MCVKVLYTSNWDYSISRRLGSCPYCMFIFQMSFEKLGWMLRSLNAFSEMYNVNDLLLFNLRNYDNGVSDIHMKLYSKL